MTARERVLVAVDVASPTTLDQDFQEELKTDDWDTESSILSALKSLGHEHALLGIFDDTELLNEKIKQFQPTVIFNLVDSFKANAQYDRDIASFLNLTGIPFTGCGPTGLTLCKNKGVSKQILSFHRIRIPKFVLFFRKKKIKKPKHLPFPLFVKPLHEESSYGISQASFVENEDQLIERVQFIQERMNQDVIAEEYIDGREIYVSVLGNQRTEVFPPREMIFGEVPEEEPKFATYKAKWDEQYRKRWGIKNQFMKDLSPELEEKVKKIAKRIYRLLSIQGYARLDMRLTPQGELVFIEANPNPILSRWEDFAESAKKADLAFPDLIQKIIKLGKARTES